MHMTRLNGALLVGSWILGNLFFIGVDLYAQKRPDLRLDTDLVGNEGVSDHRIAASGDAVYVVWEEDRGGYPNRNIYFNRSLDGGATWLASDLRLNNPSSSPGRAENPQIAVNGDSVFVAWANYGQTRYNRSFDRGSTWMPEGRVIPGSRHKSKLAVSDDWVYLVWEELPPGADEPDIYFIRSWDWGSNWQLETKRLDSDEPFVGWSGGLRIVAVKHKIYVVWKDMRDGQADIYFNRSLDRGATWFAEEVRLDTDPAGYHGSIAPYLAASGNAVHVVWRDLRSSLPDLKRYDIYAISSQDSGTTWNRFDQRLDKDFKGAANSDWVQVVASGDSAYAIWLDYRDGFPATYFNRTDDAGLSWLKYDQRLDSLPAEAGGIFGVYLYVAGKRLYLTWADRRTGNFDVYFNRSDDGGRTWLPEDVRLDSKPAGDHSSSSPRMALSGDSVYAAWTDSRGTSRDLYFTIPYGSQPYGEGTAGTGGFRPSLRGSDSLTIGSTFTLTLSEGLGGAFGVLAWGGPGSKTSIPLAGGALYVSPIAQMRPFLLDGGRDAAGEGDSEQFFSIPGMPEFIGFNVNFQAAFLDPQGQGGISLSNAVEAWIL